MYNIQKIKIQHILKKKLKKVITKALTAHVRGTRKEKKKKHKTVLKNLKILFTIQYVYTWQNT